MFITDVLVDVHVDVYACMFNMDVHVGCSCECSYVHADVHTRDMVVFHGCTCLVRIRSRQIVDGNFARWWSQRDAFASVVFIV